MRLRNVAWAALLLGCGLDGPGNSGVGDTAEQDESNDDAEAPNDDDSDENCAEPPADADFRGCSGAPLCGEEIVCSPCDEECGFCPCTGGYCEEVAPGEWTANQCNGAPIDNYLGRCYEPRSCTDGCAVIGEIAFCEEELADCGAIETAYERIAEPSYPKFCQADGWCKTIPGHCELGLGACHHALSNYHDQTEGSVAAALAELADRWQQLGCVPDEPPECDCGAAPAVSCVDGADGPSCTLG